MEINLPNTVHCIILFANTLMVQNMNSESEAMFRDVLKTFDVDSPLHKKYCLLCLAKALWIQDEHTDSEIF